jgi:hypothetical protein
LARGLLLLLLLALGEPLGGHPAQSAQRFGSRRDGCADGSLAGDSRDAGERILHDVGHPLDSTLYGAGSVEHVPQRGELLRLGWLRGARPGHLLPGLVPQSAALDMLPGVVSAESGSFHDLALKAVADARDVARPRAIEMDGDTSGFQLRHERQQRGSLR